MRFAVGDEVIVNDTDDNEGHWAFYLAGSKGIIDRADRSAYHVEFTDVVDAQPEARTRHNYDLGFLIREHRLVDEVLDPYTISKPCDNGFENVF